MGAIKYDKLGEVSCIYCGDTVVRTGPNSRVCDTCKAHLKSITHQVNMDLRRHEKFGSYDSIGKGGMQIKGSENCCYKNGEARFAKEYRPLVRARRYCEICGKDLVDAGHYEWCVHHMDFTRRNDIDNLQLLCKRCHQLTHDCIGNLPND